MEAAAEMMVLTEEMSSFSCPHFDMKRDYCTRVREACVPGRPGCVLCQNSVFAISAEERIRAREDQDKQSESRN